VAPVIVASGLALVYSPSLLAADERGDTYITIIDAKTQRSIDSANIVMTKRTGEEINFGSNEKGLAERKDLDVGHYDMVVSRTGYISSRVTSVRILDDKATPLKIALLETNLKLEETLVIGSSKGLDPLSSAGASYIDREGLRSAVGSGSDVLRALDGLPGLFSSGEFSSFTVRGNGPRDN